MKPARTDQIQPSSSDPRQPALLSMYLVLAGSALGTVAPVQPGFVAQDVGTPGLSNSPGQPRANSIVGPVPEASAQTSSRAGGQMNALMDGNALDLNLVTGSTLRLLPGLGPSLAKRIVAYRNRHGRFEQVEDLLKVPGVGLRKLAGLQALLMVEAAPPARRR